MTKQKRWKGYRSSALYLGFAAHRERVSCAGRKSCSKALCPKNLCVREPPLPPSADVLTEGHYQWLSSQWNVHQSDWRLNRWLYIRQDAFALAFVSCNHAKSHIKLYLDMHARGLSTHRTYLSGQS
jgi:hypothetical protein